MRIPITIWAFHLQWNDKFKSCSECNFRTKQREVNTILKYLLIVITLVLSQSAKAQDTLYWLGSISNEWTDPGNWGTGSSGPASLTAPTSLTTAVIQSASNDCVLDDDASLLSIEMQSGAVLDVGSSTLALSNDFQQFGGTFYGRSSTLTIAGNLLITDGVFYSTTGTLHLGEGIYEQNWESFRCSTGTVRATGDINIDILSFFYRLEIPTGVEATLANHTPILQQLEIDGTINANTKALYIDNPDFGAITGTGGVFVDVDEDIGMVVWRVAEQTGTYVFPVLSELDGDLIPLIVTIDEAGEGEDGKLLFFNIELPSNKPQWLYDIFNYTKEYGSDNSKYNTNRLRGLLINDFDESPVLSLEFNYLDEELEGLDIVEGNLVGQANIEVEWQPVSISTANAASNKVTVTGVVSETSQFWTLVDGSSPNYNVNALYWTGADDNDWDNGLNWSWEPCGDAADTIPDSTMTVVFLPCDSPIVQAILTANATVQNITYADGYSYLVDEDIYALTVLDKVVFDGVDISITTGTVNLGNDVVLSGGNVTVSGGAILAATGSITGKNIQVLLNGEIVVTGDLILEGSFVDATGEITADEILLKDDSGLSAFDGNLDITGNLVVENSGVGLGSDVFTVTGNLSLVGESSVRLTDGIVQISGNYSQAGGEVDGNLASIVIGGNFEVPSGTFISTKEDLSVSGIFSVAGSAFLHNGGEVLLLGNNKLIDLGIEISTQDVLVGVSAETNYDTDINSIMSINLDGTVSFEPIYDAKIEGVNTLDMPTVNGVSTQNIGFYNLTLGNNSYNKLCEGDVVVNGILNFNSDYISLNGHSLTINNNASSCVAFTTGGILAETFASGNEVRWNVEEETGVYTVPMVNATGEHLDFTVDITTAGVGLDEMLKPFISISSYATSAVLEPYPEGVTYWYNEDGNIDFTSIVPRVWQLQTGNYSTIPVGDIEIDYTDTDIQGIGFSESSIKLQGWMTDGWEAAEGTVSPSTNKIILSSRSFNGTLVLVDGISSFLGKLTTISYATLADELDGGYYHSMESKLYYRFDNPYADGEVSVKIFDWKRDLELNANVVMKNGTNWVEQGLSGLGLTEGQYYVLEATDQKGKTTKLRFKYVINFTISILPSPFDSVDDGGGGGG